MIDWNRPLVGFVLMCLGGAGYASDATSVDTPVFENSASTTVETFTPPRLKQRDAPNYPDRQQLKGREGWVQLNYMIDPKGKPYDVSVVSSSDEHDFEKEAIRAVTEWTYEPAILNGQPIDAGSQVFIKFGLEPLESAGRFFVLRYKQLQKYIDQGKLDKAASVLEDLQRIDRNLYEEAYYHLARYSYQLATGASERQLYESLKRAAAMDNKSGFLPDALLTAVLKAKLQSQLRLNELIFAESTALKLRNRDLEDDLRVYVDSVLKRIDELRTVGKPFATKGVVRSGNRSSHGLMHHKFSFRDVKGNIAELRLHCDRGYVGFIYRPDFEYEVEEGLQWCKLHLIGTPGTTYTLVQSPGPA